MAKMRVKINPGPTRTLLTSSELKADFQRRGEAIKQACDGESSWGGYYTATTTEGDRVSTKVWSVSSNLGENHNRHQRMIRNLDAGA
jgi:hypothetical protein